MTPENKRGESARKKGKHTHTMPAVQIKVNIDIPEAKKKSIPNAAAAILGTVIGKVSCAPV
jgi:hypothetical protein